MKKHRGLLMEILYLVVISAIVHAYWFLRLPAHNDYLLFLGWIFVLIGLMIMFGPVIGRIAVAAFCCLVFFKMDELLSIWTILIVFATIAFLILYVNTGKENKYLKL